MACPAAPAGAEACPGDHPGRRKKNLAAIEAVAEAGTPLCFYDGSCGCASSTPGQACALMLYVPYSSPGLPRNPHEQLTPPELIL
jgi:hypothetical protein